MAKRKYMLPRHTNLAKQGSRFGAFFVDLAVFLLASLILLYACFGLIIDPIVKPYNNDLEFEKESTGLFVSGDDGRQVVPELETYEDYYNNLKYYYLNYLTGNEIKEDYKASDNLRSEIDIKWFNQNVLGLAENHPNVNDEFVSQEVFIENFLAQGNLDNQVKSGLELIYDAALNDFLQTDYIVKLQDKVYFLYSLEFVLSALFGGVITYIIIPIIIKNGQTIGKKVFGLGLADSDGYKMHNAQLLMRFMPLAVVLLSFIAPVWINLFYLALAVVTVFLVSFAIAMASPKHSSLHDFCARTIVVDLRTSFIFESQVDETVYCEDEDKLNKNKEIVSGEEPELRYEK